MANEKNKKTNNDRQNTTQNTNDLATQTTQKQRVNSRTQVVRTGRQFLLY